jgi:signal transduction histidine kinase
MREQDSSISQISRHSSLLGMVSPVIVQAVNEYLFAAARAGQALSECETARDYERIARQMMLDISGAQDIVLRYSLLAKKLAPHKEPANVNRILKAALDNRGDDFKRAKTQLIAQYDLGIPLIPVDEAMLQEAFDHLISNALDAVRDRDERGLLMVTTAEKGDLVEIAFEDNGPGIPQSFMSRLFQPFFTTKSAGHEGIGLVLCKSIITMHDGCIEASQHDGPGARFVVSLPLPVA